MEIMDNLRQFLENGADWERKSTSVTGVSIIRLPASGRRSARLAVEINPVGEAGKPLKRQGVIVMNSGEGEAFSSLFNEERVKNLLAAIDTLSPDNPAQKKGTGDVLQI